MKIKLAGIFVETQEKVGRLSVVFLTKPTKMPWGSFTVFDNIYGNLIPIQQLQGESKQHTALPGPTP